MQTYQVSPEAYRQAQQLYLRKLIVLMVPLALNMATFGALWVLRATPSPAPIVTGLILALLNLCFLVALLIAWLLFQHQLKQQKKLWLSYELILEEDALQCSSNPPFKNSYLERDKIKQITEYVGQGLFIQPIHSVFYTPIPHILDGYHSVKEHLRQWQPIQVKQPYPTIYFSVVFGLFIALLSLKTQRIEFYSAGVAGMMAGLFRHPGLEIYFRSRRWWLMGMIPAIAFLLGYIWIDVPGMVLNR